MQLPLPRFFTRLWWKSLAQVRGNIWVARRKGVRVGEGCRLLTHNFGSEPWLVAIGNRVTVTASVTFVTHDGATWLFRDERGRRHRYARIEIGDDVFIGVNSIIMPGVRIGNRAIVGAGSVVTKSVPSGCIVAGNPARIIGKIEDYERRALDTFASASDMKGHCQRSRIDSVVEPGFRPEMKG